MLKILSNFSFDKLANFLTITLSTNFSKLTLLTLVVDFALLNIDFLDNVLDLGKLKDLANPKSVK